MNRYRIRRLPAIIPEYDATVPPYGLWDNAKSCYVDKYGQEDAGNNYYCVDRDVAIMRRRDLNEYTART